MNNTFLKFFVSIVDQKLLKTVHFHVFKPKDVQQSNEILLLIPGNEIMEKKQMIGSHFHKTAFEHVL